ncbi:MAG: ribonuclease Z [Bacteroidales bacterium]|nr:MAG: ribonuclease Z [Bacteroidales bacterium]
MVTFSFTILGSSSALPTSQRFPSAHLLNVNERFFLVDCGEGTQMQLRKYKLKIGKINHIFISHLHGDHTFGLFGLISTLGLLDKSSDLNIYAPPPLEQIVHDHLDAFDIHIPYRLVFRDLDCSKSEMIYEDKNLRVETIPLQHRIPTCGFLFHEKPGLRNIKKEAIEEFNIPVREIHRIKEGFDFTTESGEIIPNEQLTREPQKPRSMAYCTDTLYTENVITKIAGVDLLYHEATYMQDMADQAKESFHTTSQQAAMLAKKSGVGKLVLGHFSARYKNLDLLLEEARKIFENTFLAEDGAVFNID